MEHEPRTVHPTPFHARKRDVDANAMTPPILRPVTVLRPSRRILSRRGPGLFLRTALGAGVASLPLLISGCTPGQGLRGPLPVGTSPERVAEEALAATMPETPTQISFGFRLREADLRFSGRGVARIEPPYRVRIDLYSGGGENLFRAALVEGDLRVPPGVPRELAPPPALLWAALGVFRPDPGLQLLEGAQGQDGALVLQYGGEDGKNLRFHLTDGLLTRAEILDGDHLVEDVDLELDPSAENVVETVYRNLAMFVELTFSLESVQNVDSFPPDIWDPGR